MSENLFRSFTPELEVRSGGDGRTIYGIVVPYDAPTRIDHNLVEAFVRGVFSHQLREPHRVKLARDHVLLGGALIGAGTEMRDDAAGLFMALRAAKTPAGDETLELVRDGALDQLSIMFRDRQNRNRSGVTERVKADLVEVAVVMQGAYGDLATIAGVRSAVGTPVAAEDMELRAKAEQYLSGQPTLPDYELELRRIKLGLPF